MRSKDKANILSHLNICNTNVKQTLNLYITKYYYIYKSSVYYEKIVSHFYTLKNDTIKIKISKKRNR